MLGDISSLFWSEEVFNGVKIRDYSKREGVNPKDFEKQIWEYDTLNILKEFSDLDLFFKDGTCVQSLLPFDYQRFSIDLDFNIEIKDRTKEFILSKFRELNERLEKEDLSTPASETKYKKRSSEDLVYGKFYPRDYDEISGTLTFIRIFMTKIGSRIMKFVYMDDLRQKKYLIGVFQSHTGSGKYKASATCSKVGTKRYYVEDTEIPGIQKRIAIQVFVRGRFIRR